MKLTKKCLITGVHESMIINCSDKEYNDAFTKWKAGAFIQDAFPFLNADEREFIQTGITPETWKTIVG